MDNLTTFQSRGQFARICIEVVLAKPLIPYVFVRGEKIRVEYEGLHAVCFNCGIYGHRLDTCPVKRPQDHVQTNNGGMEVELDRGEIEKENRVAVGGVETGNPSPKQPGMDVSGSTEETPREYIPSVDEEQTNFGPWMLSKRTSRKRSTGSTHNHDGESSATKRKMGQVGKGGSRFGVLPVEKVGPARLSEAETRVLSSEGVGLVVGPEKTIVDQEMGQVQK